MFSCVFFKTPSSKKDLPSETPTPPCTDSTQGVEVEAAEGPAESSTFLPSLELAVAVDKPRSGRGAVESKKMSGK